MRFIYSTENPVEAHIITHMLEQNSIMAQVNEDHSSHAGHFIGGGVNAKISVIDDEAEKAYELISNWKDEEKAQEPLQGEIIGYKESSPPSSYLISSDVIMRWLGVIAALMLLLLFGVGI